MMKTIFDVKNQRLPYTEGSPVAGYKKTFPPFDYPYKIRVILSSTAPINFIVAETGKLRQKGENLFDRENVRVVNVELDIPQKFRPELIVVDDKGGNVVFDLKIDAEFEG